MFALLLLLWPGSAIWLIVAIALVAGIPQGLNNLANWQPGLFPSYSSRFSQEGAYAARVLCQ